MSLRRIAVSVLGFLLLAMASPSNAAQLRVDITGAFTATSSLGGVAFGDVQPYSITGIIDAGDDRDTFTNTGTFLFLQSTLVIEGVATLEFGADSGLIVELNEQDILWGNLRGSLLGLDDNPDGFGLQTDTTVLFADIPGFDVNNPTPLVVPLDVGEGGTLSGELATSSGLLVVTGSGILTQSASLTAIPAPASLPLLAAGLGALGFFSWRRGRKAAA